MPNAAVVNGAEPDNATALRSPIGSGDEKSPRRGEGSSSGGDPIRCEQSPGESPVAWAKLAAFEALVRRWNPRHGLVSRRDAGRLRERHTLDSLTLLPWWSGSLADVGSGAGFPGVPLAIARPESRVVLVERSRRKSRFLRQVVIDLELDNVEVVALDAARYRPAALFDTVAARAVAAPAAAWRLMRGLLAPGTGVALLQSREPLAATLFEDGEVRQAERDGIGWVTAVRARAAPASCASSAETMRWQGG